MTLHRIDAADQDSVVDPRPPSAAPASPDIDPVAVSLAADRNRAIRDGDLDRADKYFRSLDKRSATASADERRPSCADS